ncbi:hypothetical protein BN2537_2613 [Streptomyces venezuelae]|nr:hypothetical protein BN2537_2613 [Streptomyces venezuelae]
MERGQGFGGRGAVGGAEVVGGLACGFGLLGVVTYRLKQPPPASVRP